MQEINPSERGEGEQQFNPEFDLPRELEADKSQTPAPENNTPQSEIPVVPVPETTETKPKTGEIPGDFYDIPGLKGLADKVIESAKQNPAKLKLDGIDAVESANREFAKNEDKINPETK